MVAIPLTGSQDLKVAFKSPDHSRGSHQEKFENPQNRVISFNAKRIGGERILSDGKKSGKNVETSGEAKPPTSPQPFTASTKGLPLNLSDKKIQKPFQLPTKEKNIGKKVPMPFPTTNNIKSSPFLAKMSLNSSN